MPTDYRSKWPGSHGSSPPEDERELGSEGTREKIHAARKKGRYTGGAPLLGYDVDRVNHRLVVNSEEAKVVRQLYALYLEHRSLLTVVETVVPCTSRTGAPIP